jgi:hypothetical protein
MGTTGQMLEDTWQDAIIVVVEAIEAEIAELQRQGALIKRAANTTPTGSNYGELIEHNSKVLGLERAVEIAQKVATRKSDTR